MLLSSGRLRLMRALASEHGGVSRDVALRELLPLHTADIASILRAMPDGPVYFRLVDPPMQSFLPSLQEVDEELSSARAEENWDEMLALNGLRRRYASLLATNPSMGYRGCRLGLTQPEVLRMQVTAVLQAALQVGSEGIIAEPGILIPLVSSEEEMRAIAELIRGIADEVFAAAGRDAPYQLGALIELPRAAICAGAISRHVDFVCIGTNDLTQMTYGLSVQDTSRYLTWYLQHGIFTHDPFVTLDVEGVGYLVSMALTNIRKCAPSMTIGACGDHATDPASMFFLESLGIDFVSCQLEGIPGIQHALAQLPHKWGTDTHEIEEVDTHGS